MQIKRLPVDHPLIQALPDGPGKPTALAMFTNSGYYQRPYPEWAFQTYARQSMAHMNAVNACCAATGRPLLLVNSEHGVHGVTDPPA